MMLWIYRALVFLLEPFALRRLARLAQPCSDATQAAETSRLGHFPLRHPDTPPPDLWLHGASVGEVATLSPLIEHWLRQGQRLLVTTFTPTGLDQLHARFGSTIETAFLPLDGRAAVRLWLQAIQPPALVVAETELWPELYHQCHQADIPIVVVNARLSKRRLNRYRRGRLLYRHAIKAIAFAACQSEAEAKRWHQLGLAKHAIAVTGNLKASGLLSVLVLPNAPEPDTPKPHLGASNRFVWTAGSVHPREDAMVLAAHQALLKDHPKACLIIAPRHLKNVEAMQQQLNQLGLDWARFDPLKARSTDTHPSVYLIAEMGQLMAAYALADACFVGGTLVDVGGHNLYEPAALKKPIITGPHIEHQQAAADQLQSSGGLWMIEDSQALSDAVKALAKDQVLGKRMGGAAHSVMRQASQSLEKTLEAIEPRLPLNKRQDSTAQ